MNAYEMVKGGDWIAVQYDGKLETWNLKPPLFTWMLAMSFAADGYSNLSARIPTILLGLATAAVLYHFLCHVTRRRLLSGLAALALLTSRGFVGYHALTSADFDVPVVFFLTVAFVAAYLAYFEDRARWWWVFGLALGGGFMVKSFVGFMPLALPLLALGVRYAPRRFLSWHLVCGLAAALAVVLPWLVLREYLYADDYLRLMIKTDILRRYAMAVEGHAAPVWFYLRVMAKDLKLWLLPIGGAMGIVIYRALLCRIPPVEQTKTAAHYPQSTRSLQQDIPALGLFSLVTALYYLAAFSSAGSKLEWYILPAYPPLFAALAAGLALSAPRLLPVLVLCSLASLAHSGRSVYRYLSQEYRWIQGTASPAVDAVLYPNRDLIRGKPLITEGELPQNAYVLSRIYADLKTTHFPTIEKLSSAPSVGTMLSRSPKARFLLSSHAATYAKDPRLRLITREGPYGLFEILPEPADQHKILQKSDLLRLYDRPSGGGTIADD
jgi:4-amino-4-deoxy-L-arabinose transferase-like glycosyltransferase